MPIAPRTETAATPAMHYRRAVLLCIATLALSGSALRASGPQAPRAAQGPREALEEYFARARAYGFSGVVLVVRGEELLLQRGYGLADHAGGVPIGPETVFGMASLDKQFTAAGILLLEQDGALSTEDRIGDLLPDVPEDKKGVTLHQLLSHTSGLENDYRDEFSHVDFEGYLSLALKKPLLFPPGTSFEYSNTGYDLLVHLIEVVSEQAYEAFLAERIFEPLGMASTGDRRLHLPPERLARYEDDPRWNADIAWAREDPVHPFLSLRSTVGDMLLWSRALEHDSILSAASRKKLFQPVRNGYACGWEVGRTSRHTTVQHHGGTDTACGLLAGLYRYPDEGLVVIFFCNSLLGRTLMGDVLAQTIDDLVFGKPVLRPPPRGAATADELLRWTGTFGIEGVGDFSIDSDGEGLSLATRNRAATLLLTFPECGSPGLPWDGDARLRDAVSAIDDGNLDPLLALRAGGPSPEAFVREVKALWADFEGEHGDFRGLTLLQRTEAEFAGEPETRLYLGVAFERGAEILRALRGTDGRYELRPFRIPEA